MFYVCAGLLFDHHLCVLDRLSGTTLLRMELRWEPTVGWVLCHKTTFKPMHHFDGASETVQEICKEILPYS